MTPGRPCAFLRDQQGNITVSDVLQPFPPLPEARYAVAINYQGEIAKYIILCSVFARDRELVVGPGCERSLGTCPELDGRRDSHGR